MTKNFVEEKIDTDSISQSQTDMRQGYANGSPGIIVSGTIWLIAAIINFKYSDQQGIWTLLIGGMFIFPLSMLLSKAMGLRATHTKNNILASLAMEGTVFMLLCLPLAYFLSLQHTAWFFQGMLLIIGGRYFTFASIYGIRLYWALGATLGIAAYLLFIFKIPSMGSALAGAIIEITFGLFMLIYFRKRKLNS